MGKQAQPVPPIFQPEVAAEAIVYAAHARRREIYVGGSTVKAIVANKIMPGLLDRYLARNNAGQLSDEPADAQRPDNLFAAAPGQHGAHGRFDREARGYSLELWATFQRGWLCAGIGLAAGVAVVMFAGRRSRPVPLLPAR